MRCIHKICKCAEYTYCESACAYGLNQIELTQLYFIKYSIEKKKKTIINNNILQTYSLLTNLQQNYCCFIIRNFHDKI